MFLFNRLLPSFRMPDGKKKKLHYNFLSLGIVQAITSLLQLIVIPHVISKIGVEGFGVIAVAQVVLFYLAAFTDYGAAQTATRSISLQRNDAAAMGRIFFRVLISRLLLCGVALLLLVLLVEIVPVFRAHRIVYLSGFVFVIGQSFMINWFYQGVEQMHITAGLQLLARMLFVLLVFQFITGKGDGALYLFFLGAGNVVFGLVGIFLAIRKYKLIFSMPRIAEIQNEYVEGWEMTTTNLLNNVCLYSNIFILRIFSNDLVTGYYSIAERVFLTLRQMLAVFSQAVYPQLCLMVSGSRDSLLSYFRKIYLPFFVVFAAGSLLLFVLAPWVISIFSPDVQTASVFALRLFAIVLVIAALSVPLGLLLLAADHRRQYFRVYTMAVAVNIVLNIFLANYFRSAGTVIAILLTELFILLALAQKVNSSGLLSRKKLIR